MVFQVTLYGLEASVPIVVQVFAPAGERWKVAFSTPEPESAESELTVTPEPRTKALFAGAVRPPVGLVLSTRTRTEVSPELTVLPALSVVVTRR